MEFVKPSKRIPHTKLLPFLSKSELLLVWRDVIYELKNCVLSTNKLPEQYFVYLMMVYNELIEKGSKPNKDYLVTHTSTSFCYLDKFDKWISVYSTQEFISSQKLCNNNDLTLTKKHIDKYLAKEGALITEDIKVLEKAILNTSSNKLLIPILMKLLKEN